ncbi:MAG: toll/interleukin-1 receptor domain-containing protein [Deltaproteobacteria bacterium]|nr:toll/interleukin-1 receptor domain-containing protein [Deltaproteobacteria bacterium]
MKPIWRQTLDQGANTQLIEGVAATQMNLCNHPPGSFSASSTVILGAANSEAMLRNKLTVARWRLDLDLEAEDKWLHGFLLIACLRHYGGCHTATKNQVVEILINDTPFERFRLADIPPTHDDYFYRPPLPKFPKLNEIRDCQTVYVWPVKWERLKNRQSQSVQIQIENMVRWDIDYIGFIYEVEPHPEYDIALSYASENRVYVEKVADLLVSNGVKVFYDRYFETDL